MESDEVTESNAKNLLPIPSECVVTLEDKRECDELDIEYVDASVPDPAITSVEENVDHQEQEEIKLEEISQVQDVVLQSNNSLSLPELETFYDHTEETRSDNTTTHANYSLPEYDSFCFEIEPDQEELFGVVMIDIPDNSSNDPLLEEVDLFLFDDSIPPILKMLLMT
nr:hypothetical protein [Tanacetum cinerariifolium]